MYASSSSGRMVSPSLNGCGGRGASSMDKKVDILCKVCGDKASGKHYGVASCDGCRGFFKRSIRRLAAMNLDYVCKENGTCIVDVTRRNQCQSCRFKKCLEVNMKKEAVQHERATRSIAKQKVVSFLQDLRSHLPPQMHQPLPNTSRFHQSHLLTHAAPAHYYASQLYHQMSKSSLFLPPTITPEPKHDQTPPQSASPQALNGSPERAPSPSVNDVSEEPLKAPKQEEGAKEEDEDQANPPLPAPPGMNSNVEEAYPMPPLVPRPIPSGPSTPDQAPFVNHSLLAGSRYLSAALSTGLMMGTYPRIGSAFNFTCLPELTSFPVDPTLAATAGVGEGCNNIHEIAAKVLFISIKWIKTVPSFTGLQKSDQVLLLESSWTSLFILTISQWNIQIDEDSLVRDAQIDPGVTQDQLLLEAKLIKDVIQKLMSFRLDSTEFTCLKALCLFKPDLVALRQRAQIEMIQDQIHIMLQEYCQTSCRPNTVGGGVSGTNKIRFGKLLLILPRLQGICTKTVVTLFFRKTVGNMPIEKIISDLFQGS